MEVAKNPIKDGQVMLCDICGAFTHLQARCPHNPNNNIFVADAEDWEDGKPIIADEDEMQQDEIYQQIDHAVNIANAIGKSVFASIVIIPLQARKTLSCRRKRRWKES